MALEEGGMHHVLKLKGTFQCFLKSCRLSSNLNSVTSAQVLLRNKREPNIKILEHLSS